jgi:hypothetical protein
MRTRFPGNKEKNPPSRRIHDEVIAASFGVSAVSSVLILLEFITTCFGHDCDVGTVLVAGFFPAAGAAITVGAMMRDLCKGVERGAISVITTLVILGFHLLLVLLCGIALF